MVGRREGEDKASWLIPPTLSTEARKMPCAALSARQTSYLDSSTPYPVTAPNIAHTAPSSFYRLHGHNWVWFGYLDACANCRWHHAIL